MICITDVDYLIDWQTQTLELRKHGWLHACFGIGLLEDLEPKGEGGKEEGVACHLLLGFQIREGGVVHQLQQTTIQRHLTGGGGGGGGGVEVDN